MGRLVIAHHKSYHPYRRDNIDRVRKDEEEARLAEEREDGRIQLADAEARIDLLRERAGDKDKKKRRVRPEDEVEHARRELEGASERDTSGLPSRGGHINFFEDLEQSSIVSAIQTSRAAKSGKDKDKEDERGFRLAPSEKDLKPWYSSSNKGDTEAVEEEDDRRRREAARKIKHDPLTHINSQLSSGGGSSSTSLSSSRRSHPSFRTPALPTSSSSAAAPQDATAARLARESSERGRAQALLARKKREREATLTPSTVGGGGSEYGDMFNRDAVLAAQARREGGRGERDWDGRRVAAGSRPRW